MQERIVRPDEAGQRLEKYIKRKLPLAETSFVYRMLRRKNIKVNGGKADASSKVGAGDVVTFYLSDETFAKFGGKLQTEGASSGRQEQLCASLVKKRRAAETAFEELSRRYRTLRVVYEDENILAANKPAGLLSQKASERDVSLNEWFLGYLFQTGFLTEDSLTEFTPSVMNRLDRNTSGLVLCAKTLAGSRMLAELLRERTLRKYYHMIVCGKLEQEQVIEGYLSKDERSNTVRIFQEAVPGAGYTKTILKPLKSVRFQGQEITLAEAELVTGKTHQLRAHLQYIGHPILGDPKYGDPALNKAAAGLGVRHQLLCCVRVEFPRTKAPFDDLSGRIISIRPPAVFDTIPEDS